MRSNWKFQTISIKGKEYVTINERVKAFRNCEEFEGWSIKTEILSVDSDSVIIKAVIEDKDGKVLATGHAQEDRTSTIINKTSYIENCETSAVGRALGMLGIGIENSIATYDEVKRAISAQEAMENKPKTTSVEELNKALSEVELCQNKEELKALWNKHKALQTNDKFRTKVQEVSHELY